LQVLRERIEALSRKLDRQEENRREARDALRDSERAISQANRSLARLQAVAGALRAEAAALDARRGGLERSLTARQAAIERMLRARQAAGAPDALRVALSGEDPATLSRMLGYAGYVSRAAAAMLAAYRSDIAEAARLAAELGERREQLAQNERASRADRERILAERRERKRVFRQVAAEVRNGRREIKVLRADEARLGRLIEGIGKAIYARVEKTPEPGNSGQPFSALRGKLRLPVLGELTGRFGAPRGPAGSEAKGVFIRAPEGRPVKAIAGGQVVYADWMRGFGNLMIIDHGETYLSIYANNESLHKQVGDLVSRGETVATTGASGGNEETGLYFELRHLGRAFDPLRWVKLK
jgi:septal ring factor EnvC (AmiA/AmiB activator)